MSVFKKGHIPWNKGKKGWHGSPESEFKKGQLPRKTTPFFSPHIINHKRDGRQMIASIPEYTKGTSRGRTYRMRKRTSYARVIAGYMDIPKGYVVYHLDKNPLNNDPTNLKIISRAELIQLNIRKRS
jgi:hypothetical protein